NVVHPIDVIDSNTFTSNSSIASTNNLDNIPMDVKPTVSTPANAPGPVTRINIRLYTNAVIVRIIIKINLVNHGKRFRTRLDSDKKANGKYKNEQIIVPRKAIANVSTSKYGTLSFEKLNKLKSGLNNPEIITFATCIPFWSTFSNVIDVTDQT